MLSLMPRFHLAMGEVSVLNSMLRKGLIEKAIVEQRQEVRELARRLYGEGHPSQRETFPKRRVFEICGIAIKLVFTNQIRSRKDNERQTQRRWRQMQHHIVPI